MKNTRRQFIRQFSILSLAAGIDLPSLLANNPELITGMLLLPTNLPVGDTDKLLIQQANYNRLKEMSSEEIASQQAAMIKILAETKKATFTTLSDQNKIKRINSLRAFEQKPNISASEIDSFYEDIKTARQVMAQSMTGVGLVYKGAELLAIATGGAALVLTPPGWVVTTMFVGATGFFAWEMYDLLGNKSRNKDLLIANTVETGNILGAQVYDKFFKTSTFKFDQNLDGFQLNVDTMPSQNEIVKRKGSGNITQKEYIDILQKALQDNSLKNKAELKEFLETYYTKLGALQKKNLEEVLEANRKSDKQLALEKRNEAYFYQSLNNFVNTAIQKFASPQEAKILTVMSNAGFEYVIAGGFTGFGWAAVGINLASALMSSGQNGGEFEKAVFKMLKQIQQQLNTIIEKIDILHQQQIEILKKLEKVLAEVIKTQDLVNARFDEITSQMNVIYRSILTIEKQNITHDFDAFNRNLKNALIDGVSSTSSKILQDIQGLKNLALDSLTNKVFTRYDSIPLDGQYIKDEIFFLKNNYRYKLPLYDTIGMVPILANFSISSPGQSNIAVVNPPEFYNVVNCIVDWLLLSKLPKNDKLIVVNDLLAGAEKSRKALNECASKTVITRKADEHARVLNDIHLTIKNKFNELIKTNLEDKSQLLKQLQFSSGNITTISNLTDNSMGANDSNPGFYTNNNDKLIYNLAVQLGIIQQTARISTTKYKKDGAIGVGSIVGGKVNQFILRDVFLNVEGNVKFDLDVTETRSLVVTAVKNCVYHMGGGSCDVRSTTLAINFDEAAWKTTLTNYLKSNYNLDVHVLLPTIASMTFDEFLHHLINVLMIRKKREYMNIALKAVFPTFKIVDGTGVSLMVLSKLNQLITYDDFIPYNIDYIEELYTKEDVESLLSNIANINFEKEGKFLLRSLNDEYEKGEISDPELQANSPLYVREQSGKFVGPLNPNNFLDLITIIYKSKVKKTINTSIHDTNEISAVDSEPFLGEVINSLKGLKNHYLV